MPEFFGFNYVTDPPNDEKVNEVTQINNNLDKIDLRLNQFQQRPVNTITGPPIGTEAYAQQGAICVWTGSTWKAAEDLANAWESWNNLTLASGIVERPGFTPKFRINQKLRKVQLRGGLRADINAGPWPRSKVKVSSNSAGVSSIYKPTQNNIQQTAVGISTTANQAMSARIFVETNGSLPVAIFVGYQGDDGGGNFVVLDGISWWY